MPRFVILEHDHPHRHWDFMLEAGDVLRTWRLAQPPEPAVRIAAEALGDHRHAYLDYEGPLAGHRGSVTRWDFGTFAWVNDGKGLLVVDLEGMRLMGRVQLEIGEPGWVATYTPS